MEICVYLSVVSISWVIRSDKNDNNKSNNSCTIITIEYQKWRTIQANEMILKLKSSPSHREIIFWSLLFIYYYKLGLLWLKKMFHNTWVDVCFQRYHQYANTLNKEWVEKRERSRQKRANDSVLRIQIVVKRITPIQFFFKKRESTVPALLESADEKKVKWYNTTVRAFCEQCKILWAIIVCVCVYVTMFYMYRAAEYCLGIDSNKRRTMTEE